MADFSYLTPTESDESDVENIISQAIDLCVLEQIATLNTSHLTESVLPTDLETRFQKLKLPPPLNQEKENIPRTLNRCVEPSKSSPDKETDINSQYHSVESMKPEVTSSKRDDVKDLNLKSRAGSLSSRSSSPDLYKEASSPPQPTCCFWCSPKRALRKKRTENGVMGFDFNTGDDELLSDLSTFSMREQRQRLKNALKEEEKVSREAEKVVNWVKQASARMDVSKIEEDLFSDDEKFK